MNRKRIYLRGMDNSVLFNSYNRLIPNAYRENNTTWSYKVKRK